MGLLFLPFEEWIPDNTEMDASFGGLSQVVVDVTSSPLPVNVITRAWEGECKAVFRKGECRVMGQENVSVKLYAGKCECKLLCQGM